MSINVVMVPVTPEQPKSVSNQQLFVYVNKNVTGGRYFTGTLLTGTQASFTSSDIPNAVIGDIYLNTGTGIDRGRIYKCIVSAVNGVATWSYAGNTSVVDYMIDNDSSINVTLDAFTCHTFSDAIQGASDINITIPEYVAGNVAEIDFEVDSSWTGTFTITNTGTLPITYMREGMVLDSYTPSIDRKVNMLFRCNGTDVLCVIVEYK